MQKTLFNIDKEAMLLLKDMFHVSFEKCVHIK